MTSLKCRSIVPSLHKVPLWYFVSGDMIYHGVCGTMQGAWDHDSHLSTDVVAHFNVGGGLGHSSTNYFFTHFMKWLCSLKPKLTGHVKENLQRFKDCFFPSITVLPPYTKHGLSLLHPRYQISSVLPGNLWTVSVTLKALSSK